MSKPPSPQTEIRTLKRELNYLRQDNQRLKADCIKFRERATKAEQEVAEWKQRFDALMKLPFAAPDTERKPNG